LTDKQNKHRRLSPVTTRKIARNTPSQAWTSNNTTRLSSSATSIDASIVRCRLVELAWINP